MVPALGRTRRHHFKHKAGRPASCHDETYLHHLAKETLFAALEGAIRTSRPYGLTRERQAICSHFRDAYGFSCTRRHVPDTTDLAAIFDRVEMEAGADGFVADILLSSSSSGERLLLEIFVTHPCEEAKIASGLPIVEIPIHSEDDAASLGTGLDARSGGTRCYNLPVLEALPHRCSEPCPATALVMLSYQSGKAWYSETGIERLSEVLADPHLLAHDVIEARAGRHSWSWSEIQHHLREHITREVFERGRDVRSCLLCWNNEGRATEHDIRCSAKERLVWMSSSALGCGEYDPAEDAGEVKRIFEKLR